MTDPSASSAPSSAVATVRVALPVVGTVTVCEPGVTPKSPVWATATVTSNAAVGAGTADTVNTASPPSLMPLPAVMLISGSGCTTVCVGMPSTVSVNFLGVDAR